jgi:dynein heavy chain
MSQQHHYDFGMRAIKSALMAAQSIKLKQPLLSEEHVIVRAISEINVPKFITSDQVLFRGIM